MTRGSLVRLALEGVFSTIDGLLKFQEDHYRKEELRFVERAEELKARGESFTVPMGLSLMNRGSADAMELTRKLLSDSSNGLIEKMAEAADKEGTG